MNQNRTHDGRRGARRPTGPARRPALALGALAFAFAPSWALGDPSPESGPGPLALAGSSTTRAPSEPASEEDVAIARAKRAIADCQARFAAVEDYTCTFLKRELVEGSLTPPSVMAMKARTKPHSIYFKFQCPTPGREAIYVAGRHGGRVLAHDVGLIRVLSGTMALDPRGDFAMEDCRHPITEAGLGHLIETVAERWEVEMKPGQMEVAIHSEARVGDRPCTLIESIHPTQRPDYVFHKVRLYIDREHGLPIRFEAYDWPRQPGAAPRLLEEYTFKDLALNVGLRDRDFDPANTRYSFGRF